MSELVHTQAREVVQWAADCEGRIVARMRDIRASWVALAADLYEFHASKGWQALGYETLEEWLAQPDVEMARRTFFSLVETHRELAVQRAIPIEALERVDVTKVQEVLPAIRRGQVDASEALADAEVLSRSDLREKYRAIAPLDTEPDRSIAPDDFHWETCASCGQRLKVLDR